MSWIRDFQIHKLVLVFKIGLCQQLPYCTLSSGVLQQRGRPASLRRLAGRTGQTHSQRKTGRSRWGTPCFTYRQQTAFFRQGAPGKRVRLSFCPPGKPSPSGPPGFLIRFRTGDRSLVQLTEENEKSEPFSYWKKVRILCLWCG